MQASCTECNWHGDLYECDDGQDMPDLESEDALEQYYSEDHPESWACPVCGGVVQFD